MGDPAMISKRDRRRPARPLLRTMLGDALRRTRLEQRRTLADVARIARVSMPYLSELERGRKEASSEVLAAICDALRIDLSDLLAEVRRDLAGGRGGRVPALRLASIREPQAPRSTPGGGEEPAAPPDVLAGRAGPHRTAGDLQRGAEDPLPGAGPAHHGAADARCLLAA